jgi:hypothetical protein
MALFPPVSDLAIHHGQVHAEVLDFFGLNRQNIVGEYY